MPDDLPFYRCPCGYADQSSHLVPCPCGRQPPEGLQGRLSQLGTVSPHPYGDISDQEVHRLIAKAKEAREAAKATRRRPPPPRWRRAGATWKWDDRGKFWYLHRPGKPRP